MTDQTASFSQARQVPAGRTEGRIRDLPWPVGLYFFTVVIPMSVDAGPLVLTSLRLVLMALVVPVTIRLLSGHYGRVRVTDLLFMVFVAWTGVAVGVNNPTRVVEFVGSTGLEFFGGYLMGRAFIRTPQDFMALSRTIILFLLLTLPLAMFESLTGRSLVLEVLRSLPGIITMGDNKMEQRLGLWRVQLTFAHPIHYGVFCSMAFSLAFVGLKGQTSTAWRYVSSGLIALCVFLSLSSGAVLALALQIMLIVWAAVFAGMQRRWRLLVAILATAYVLIDSLSNRTPFDVFLSYATFSSDTAYYRSLILEYGMKNVWGSPIYGIGLNDWVRAWYMGTTSVDNFWLLTAMRYGIPGFLLLVTGYVIGLAKVMRCDFGTDPMLSQLRLAWVFTFLGMSFSLSTVALWTNIYSFVFFMYASGMWLTEAQPARSAAAAPPARGQVPRRAAAGPDPARPGPARPGPAPPGTAPPVLADAPAATPATGPAGPRYTRFPAPAGRPRSARGGPPLAES